MKGFIFTLDALFALVVAAAATSILLYAFFTTPTSVSNPSQEALSLTQSLLSETLAQACPGTYLFNAIACNSLVGSSSFGFGSYNAPPTWSVLQTIANLYLNNNGPYGSLLLGAVYPSNTTAIFINSVYGPSIGLQTGSFSGSASYISIPNNALRLSAYGTVTAWIYPNGISTTNNGIIDNIYYTAANGFQMNVKSTALACKSGDPGGISTATFGTTFSVNTLYNVACVFNGNYVYGYVNGVRLGSYVTVTHVISNPTASTFIGAANNNGNPTTAFQGYISNVQLYNGALTTTQIYQLYQQGLTGTPIMANVVAWWPLNGNANDYSGNGYNGAATSVSYSTAITPNYQPQWLNNAFQISGSTVHVILNASGTSRLYNVSVGIWH